ncbi:MAG: hypothetical protein HY769_03550 [Candidatus Stahlbacteria bacterium]|nr:hypothetical protein [Candidatus Stahlbacteria bacterium]
MGCGIIIVLSIYIVLDTIKMAPEDWIKRAYYLKIYIVGFSVLIILFTMYILQQENIIHRMARKLFNEMQKEERVKTASELAKMTNKQLQEIMEIIRLAMQSLKPGIAKAEDKKHLERIEEEVARADDLINSISRLPDLISKEKAE